MKVTLDSFVLDPVCGSDSFVFEEVQENESETHQRKILASQLIKSYLF